MNVTQWKRLKPHPLAQLFPRPTEAETQALIDGMKDRGYDKKQPIILADGKILDGLSRWDAAKTAEVEPTFDDYKGNDQLGFVISRNLHRRHLTTSQRQILAADIANLDVGQHSGKTHNPPIGGFGSSPDTEESGISQEQAAEAVGTSIRGVQRAAAVKDEAAPAVVDAVRDGTITVADAEKIKDQPKKKQTSAVDKVRKGKAKTAAEAAGVHDGQKASTKARARIAAQAKPLLDAVGKEIPKRLRDVFADTALPELIEEIKQTEAMLTADSWAKRAGKLCDHYPFILVKEAKDHGLESLHQLQLQREALEAGLPHAVCPKCNGEKREAMCRGCRGAGFVPETRYKELTNGSL